VNRALRALDLQRAPTRFEQIVEDGLAQSAEIVIVESEAPDSLGRVAALLRY
jgi:hypothetical protein